MIKTLQKTTEELLTKLISINEQHKSIGDFLNKEFAASTPEQVRLLEKTLKELQDREFLILTWEEQTLVLGSLTTLGFNYFNKKSNDMNLRKKLDTLVYFAKV